MKEDVKYIIAFVVMILLLFLVSPAEAKDWLGMSMEDGSTVTLTDEQCTRVNPETKKPLVGMKARGVFDGDTYSACWKQVQDRVFIIWFPLDGPDPLGVTQHMFTDFKKLNPV